jgi:hypothetical protein
LHQPVAGEVAARGEQRIDHHLGRGQRRWH